MGLTPRRLAPFSEDLLLLFPSVAALCTDTSAWGGPACSVCITGVGAGMAFDMDAEATGGEVESGAVCCCGERKFGR